MTMQRTGAYYATQSVEQVLQELKANLAHGLTDHEVSARRQDFNELVNDEHEPIYMKFIDQLKQPLILLLLASAGVSLLLGQWDDAFSITLAILIVVTVAFVQEYRSEKSLEALNQLVPHYCHVMRNGAFVQLMARQLVPGDIVKFATGDRVPADVRLCQAASLYLDESMLTGETEPRAKSVEQVQQSEVTKCQCVAFMGTLVRAGHGLGVVVATGRHSEFGTIWAMMRDVEQRKTPLQLNMELLGKQLSMMSFAVIAVITVIGLMQGHDWLETFNVAVSLAVAAIPEGLPIVVTVTLAFGVMRMASKNAIVKRLPSVESLGSVNVLCCDKTGTITRNEMSVVQLFTVDDGIQQVGHVTAKMLAERKSVQSLLRTATLCNNAQINGESMGQPTELALLTFADRFNFKDERVITKRLSETPFDSTRKWMAIEVKGGHHVKGAVEKVLEMCTQFATGSDSQQLTDETQSVILRQARSMAMMGHRVVAFAHGTKMSQLKFTGAVGIYDQPRTGVTQAISQLYSCGVRVIMITGDSEPTAISIARHVGILASDSIGRHVVSGADLDHMNDAQLVQAVATACVFNRTTPKHKLQIVKALQQHGDVVAMTGDGVNDGPALKLADIGISMGRSGTDVSKEAADMILVDDDFATILAAIEEGKSIYHNIRNFLTFQLSTSVAALTLIAVSIVCGLQSPLNPMQILWINIIMDGPPAQSLGVEPVDHDVMRKPPRRKYEPMIDGALIRRVLTQAFIIATGTLIVFVLSMQDGTVTKRDTTMTFTTFVMFDLFNAMSCRSEKKSILIIGLTSNRPLLYSLSLSVACQLLVIYVPFFQSIFQTAPLTLLDLAGIVALTSGVWLVDELVKAYKYVGGIRRLHGKSLTTQQANDDNIRRAV